jgi:branched-chain amino acid transport system permease protein
VAATLKKSLFAAVWILILTFPMAGLHVDKEGRISLGAGAFALAGAVLLGGLLWAGVRPLGTWMRRASAAVRARRGFALPPKAKTAAKASAAALFAIVLLTLPFWGGDRAVNKYLGLGFETCLYAVLALGLTVTVGWTGLLVLGYAAFFGVGAYTYAILNLQAGVPFWPALLAGGAVAALAGFLLGLPSLRLRGDYLAIVTLGFGEIVRYLLKNLSWFTGGEQGLPNQAFQGKDGAGIADPRVFSWSLSTPTHYYYLAIALLVVSVLILRRLIRSRVGRTWIAIREDETAAQAMGINIFHWKLLAFTISSAFAGVAGVLYAARMKFVNPEAFTFDCSVLILAMVILGGMGSIPGAIVGAVLLGIIPWALRDPIPTLLHDVLPASWAKGLATVPDYRIAVFGLLLVLMMVFRPEGIIGEGRRKIEEAPAPTDPGKWDPAVPGGAQPRLEAGGRGAGTVGG